MVTTIYGNVPSKSNCYKIVKFGKKAGLAKTLTLYEYERSFAAQMGNQHQTITGDFKLVLSVYYPSRRADLDNSLKVVLDCLQRAKAIENDRHCQEIHAKRFVDKDNSRVEFILIPIHDEKTET